MVFNLKHGWCPAWLPLRRCAAVHLGLEQARGRSGLQCSVLLQNVNSWRKERKNNDESAGCCCDST